MKVVPYAVALLSIGTGLITPMGMSAAILDQSYEPPTLVFRVAAVIYDAPNPPSMRELSQTFTVGIHGQLEELHLLVGTDSSTGVNSELLIDVRPTIGGVPLQSDSSALFSKTIPASTLPDFLSVSIIPWTVIDLSDVALTVTPGQTLSIVLRTRGVASDDTSYGSYHWLLGLGDGYGSGSAFGRSEIEGAWTPSIFPEDYGFRTYVTPIPEPNALALLGVGIVTLLAKHRSQRHR